VEIRLTVTIRGVASPGMSVRGSGAGLTPLYLEGVEQPVREALHAARCAAEARPHPPGRYPAVVAGGWGGVLLHEAVGHALEADVAGAWTERRLGDRVAPEAVTLVDDPTAPGRRGSASFDDEGTPTAERPLVAGGCLAGRLSDRRTVLAGGPAPAGNGRRQDFRHPPLPRMSNLCLRPGGESLDTLLSSVDDGLYIRRLSGGRYDPAAGTFRVAWAEAFRIERGKPTYPLAAGALVGNTRDFLMGIEGIGGEVEWDAGHGHCEKRGQVVPIGTAMPSIRIASIVVVPVEQGP
jgi:TldD protein